MIEIAGLRKVYANGHEALHDVTMTVDDGELVCLLGPSGCGKSTMLNIIAGLLDPTSGNIRMDGESLVGRHPKDRNVGMVFQNYALYPHMTVLENTMFPLRVGDHKVRKAEASRIAHKYMKLTSIEELADKKPSEISGGQQQRVAIARALVQNPKVLLLDEPLSNLDARLRLRIREEIRRLVKEMGMTTIFVTHDQEEALSISDRIVLLDSGVVQQFDVPQNLYLDPVNLFVAKFMGNPVISTFEMDCGDGVLQGEDFSVRIDALDPSRFRRQPADGRYTLGIRPEYFQVVDHADPRALFTVTIESVEMIGRTEVLHFSANGVRARAVVDSRDFVAQGSEVSFALEYPHLYLFAPDGSRVY